MKKEIGINNIEGVFFVLIGSIMLIFSTCKNYENLNSYDSKMQKDGIWVTCSNSNGTEIIEIIEYKRGVRDGLYIAYFLNGNIKDIGQYKNGKKFGLWRKYMSNGSIVGRIRYNKKGDIIMYEIYNPIF